MPALAPLLRPEFPALSVLVGVAVGLVELVLEVVEESVEVVEAMLVVLDVVVVLDAAGSMMNPGEEREPLLTL